MKKFTAISLLAFAAASFFMGCSKSEVTIESSSTNVGVYSFSLAKNDSILANLDTVFFSIDLVERHIFNADSLPYGTDVSKLVAYISTMDEVKKMELVFTGIDGAETKINYLENKSDSINFTSGPVLLNLQSGNGEVEATYTIDVYVHKVKSDSLVWGQTARTAIPSQISVPTRGYSAKMGNTTYVLTNSADVWSMACRENPLDEWDMYSATVPSGASVNSFRASSDALYILVNKDIYSSADGGKTWAATGTKADYLYGGYADKLLCAVENGEKWQCLIYPDNKLIDIPEGMPTEGTSPLLSYSFELGNAPVATFVGGNTAEDIVSGDSWAFDGNSWMKITAPGKGIASPSTDMVLVPFFGFSVNSYFIVTEYSIFMAFGGTSVDEPNLTTYISKDYGRSWSKGSDYIQLPEYMQVLTGSQAYVETLTLNSRSGDEWETFDTSYRIPASACIESPFEWRSMSRATAPVTEWECPYIYLYCGNDSQGKLNQYVWRGTINRLTFKPLY